MSAPIVLAWMFRTDLRDLDDLQARLDAVWPTPWNRYDSDSRPDAIASTLTPDAVARIEGLGLGAFVANIWLRSPTSDSVARTRNMEVARARLFEVLFPAVGARDILVVVPKTRADE